MKAKGGVKAEVDTKAEVDVKPEVKVGMTDEDGISVGVGARVRQSRARLITRHGGRLGRGRVEEGVRR